ncbi:hypothetical protein ACLG6S_10820 [Thermodesulfobacteriota bacterium B35]
MAIRICRLPAPARPFFRKSSAARLNFYQKYCCFQAVVDDGGALLHGADNPLIRFLGNPAAAGIFLFSRDVLS